MPPPIYTEERIAQALCTADGYSPYEHHVWEEVAKGGVMQGPRWLSYVPEARRFIAAYIAITTLMVEMQSNKALR
jgi:hypothetical protein